MPFDGEEIHALPAHVRVKKGLSQVPEGRQMFGPLSVEDNLKLGAWTRGDAEVATDIEAIYETFPLLKENRHAAAEACPAGLRPAVSRCRIAAAI